VGWGFLDRRVSRHHHSDEMVVARRAYRVVGECCAGRAVAACLPDAHRPLWLDGSLTSELREDAFMSPQLPSADGSWRRRRAGSSVRSWLVACAALPRSRTAPRRVDATSPRLLAAIGDVVTQ
jgi:hypothetical protein